MGSLQDVRSVLQFDTQSRGWEKKVEKVLSGIRDVEYEVDVGMGIAAVYGKIERHQALRKLNKGGKHVRATRFRVGEKAKLPDPNPYHPQQQQKQEQMQQQKQEQKQQRHGGHDQQESGTDADEIQSARRPVPQRVFRTNVRRPMKRVKQAVRKFFSSWFRSGSKFQQTTRK